MVQDVASRIDATRIRDGLPVCIKRVAKLGFSHRLTGILHEGANKFDPGNHCVPILDELQDPLNDDRGPIGSLVTYLVMPVLLPVIPATFNTIGDVVEFTSQLLLVSVFTCASYASSHVDCGVLYRIVQGLHHLHRNKIAHRYSIPHYGPPSELTRTIMTSDCSIFNVMMGQDDGRASSPQDSFASRQGHSSSRVKYYFVGLGDLWDCSIQNTTCTCSHYLGNSQDAPDVNSWMLSYDPLALDIYLIGNILRCDS